MSARGAAAAVAMVLTAAGTLTACDDASSGPSSESTSLQQTAARFDLPAAIASSGDLPEVLGVALRAQIPQVSEVRAVTAENDPLGLLGRPDGYRSAAVVVDRRGSCASDALDVACGARIELWGDPAQAKQRAAALRASAHGRGRFVEYDFVRRSLLLRVTSVLGQSEADAYRRVLLGGQA